MEDNTLATTHLFNERVWDSIVDNPTLTNKWYLIGLMCLNSNQLLRSLSIFTCMLGICNALYDSNIYDAAIMNLIAHVTYNAARCLFYMEKYEDLCRLKLSIFERIFEPKDPKNLEVKRYVAEAMSNIHSKLKESEKILQEIIPIHIEVYGPRNTLTLKCRRIISNVKHFLHKIDESDAIVDELIPIYMEMFGHRFCNTIYLKHVKALNRVDSKQFDEAKKIIDEILPIQIEQTGTRNKTTLLLKRTQIKCEFGLNQLEKTEQIIKEILPIHVEIFGIIDCNTQWVKLIMAVMHILFKRFNEAEPILEEILKNCTEFGYHKVFNNKRLYVRTMVELENVKRKLGKHDEAKKIHDNIERIRAEDAAKAAAEVPLTQIKRELDLVDMNDHEDETSSINKRPRVT